MPSPSTELCPATIKIEPSNLRDSTHFLQKLPKKEPPPGKGGVPFCYRFWGFSGFKQIMDVRSNNVQKLQAGFLLRAVECWGPQDHEDT